MMRHARYEEAMLRLNQITLPSQDLAVSVDFYRRLGLRLIVSAEDRYARFEMPVGDSTLSIHRVAGERQPGEWCPVVYFEVDDVDSVVSRLEEAGIEFDSEPTDQRWLWREARLRDPDGNRLCIFHAGVNRRNPPWRVS